MPFPNFRPHSTPSSTSIYPLHPTEDKDEAFTTYHTVEVLVAVPLRAGPVVIGKLEVDIVCA